MNLTIENFAKIKKADIEILGITVIAGENNTGKSTIGKVLYCLFECFHDLDEKLFYEKRSALNKGIRRHIELIDESLEKNNFFKILDKILQLEKNIYSKKEKLDEFIDNLLNDPEIEDVTEIDNIKNFVFNFLNLDNKDIRNNLTNKYINMEFDYQAIPLNGCIEKPHISLNFKKNKIELIYIDVFHVQEYVNIINELVYIDDADILNDINSSLYFASRFLRINQEFKSIINHQESLVDKLQKGKVENNLFEEAMSKKSIDRILNKIDTIAHGKFVDTENYLGFQENGISEPLHLSNLSTGLKSFVLIKKLIEDGYIKTNGIIVLDEPEVHLHPKWQLVYAEILVILQKELNLNIILTSHSPYFINAIEVYSAKYEIADKCKYYLSDLIDDKAIFEDVTTNIDKIYAKLAMPLQELEDISFE